MSTTNLNSETRTQIRLKKNNYKLRITEEPTLKFSKKGNAMLVFKMEITDPAVQFDKGVEQQIAGRELTLWATFFTDDNGQERNPNLGKIHSAAGLPMDITRDENTGLPVDENGVPYRYAGTVVDALCGSEEYEQKDDDGNILKNPKTGEELKGYSDRIVQLY